MDLRGLSAAIATDRLDIPDIPDLRKRKRGRRGGIRARFRRRRFTPPVPSILTGNVQSLSNKLDELSANVKYLNEYRDCSFLCLTETWFKDSDSNIDSDIDGFICKRMDRTPESGKSLGGGVCIYVNEKWCTNICVKYNYCLPDVELITVGLLPHYLPREFPQIFVTVVYIHPRADINNAASTIYEIVHDLEKQSPDALQLIMGDFNKCDLKPVLPHYHQYVDIPTRGNRTLDKCYGNVADAYKSTCLLGKSDHDMIYLLPTYNIQKLKQNKPITRKVRSWNQDNLETLRYCFECTDWDDITGFGISNKLKVPT